MSVSILVPWRPGCPARERAYAWVREQYAIKHPSWEWVEGLSPEGPFSRSSAIIDAASKATGGLFVVTDSDVYCDPRQAVRHAAEDGWAVPHELIHRLSAESTSRVLAGEDWRGLPLSTDNPQDTKPYRGNETGTLFAIRRDVLERVPPDPRFVGWGSEDLAYRLALNTLVGRCWRGSADLVHLHHPPQDRLDRKVGSKAGKRLFNQYAAARRSPEHMAALVDEGRRSWTPPTTA